jgi:hypothetical protein
VRRCPERTVLSRERIGGILPTRSARMWSQGRWIAPRRTDECEALERTRFWIVFAEQWGAQPMVDRHASVVDTESGWH